MARVLVTGGSGTLGREVVVRLARDGHVVRVMSRLSREPEAGSQAGTEWAQADLQSGEGLAGVMVGSEGTLGLITEATLATQTLPRHRGVVLLLHESLEKAARSVPIARFT